MPDTPRPETFDAREIREPQAREAELLARFREILAVARDSAPHYAGALMEIEPETITARADLARVPILRKSDLPELQATRPPLGGLSGTRPHAFRRLFLSPGPIAEPEGAEEHWRMARALHAAGFRPGDIVMNCFSYHLTPAGFMFDHAVGAIGACVFPGGTGNTRAQGEAIGRLAITGYVGTPDFLRTILEEADAADLETATLTRACVTGGPLFPALRDWYGARGISVRQCYGTAELGLIAYETGAPADGLVIDEDALVEIVRPGTGDPVPDGEVGEVVVTTFNPAYPLIRLATGDLSKIMAGTSPCGRTNRRLAGWMGRADQTAKVRGMFVHPRQVADVLARCPSIARARLRIDETDGRDDLTFLAECELPEPGLAETIAEHVRAACRVRATVDIVTPGTLPNDGKVIEDARTL